jgi:DNA polymerase III subunit epsilon
LEIDPRQLPDVIDPSITPISACRFCAIDFESAGAARGSTDTPVQVGIATWSTGSTTLGHSFVSHLKTQQPIQWSAQRVHGITPADLADAPSLAMLWPEIKRNMHDAVIVAHGKGTEKRFLRALPGHGFGPWIDTLVLARAAWPHLPDHSLGKLCDALDLTESVSQHVPGKSWHDALFDAVASLVVLKHLIAALDLFAQPVAHLTQPSTSAWHRSRKS